jgi:hypothetical protein
MAGKHNGADAFISAIGPNYYPGSKIDLAYSEGREAGQLGATTGSDDTSTNAATMTDSTASFPTAGVGLDGKYINNLTNNGRGLITSNTATVITATLSDGQKWDSGDLYSISGAVITDNPHDGLGSPAETAWDAGLVGFAIDSRQRETAG